MSLNRVPDSSLTPESLQLSTNTQAQLFHREQQTNSTLGRQKTRQKKVQKLVKYIPIITAAVMGISATLKLTFNGQWREALVVLGVLIMVMILLVIGGKFVTKCISLVETRLEELSLMLAAWTVSQLENLVMRLWWGLTSQFQGKYYQDLRYTYCTYRTQGLKTPGTFIPDLDKMFVPLQVVSKSPAQIPSAMIQKQVSAGNLHIWDFLAEIPKQPIYKRIVVLGAPGSGKTTMLECLTLTYAQNTQRQEHRKAPKLIPILLRLRQIHAEITINNPPDLAQLVTYLVRTQESSLKLEPPPQWFAERLAQGKCLVMLDGLDEVANETQRQKVSQWVDRQMRLYPETSFIVTARPFGYHSATLREARLSLEVQPYNLDQAEQYINKWYLQNEIMRQVRKEDPGVRLKAKKKANDLIRRIKNYAPLADMAQNPLILTMMATVHDNRGALPGSRNELYAEICEVLLLRRQDAKGIVDEKIKLRADQKQSVLQALALELMKRNSAQFTLDLGKELIKTQLAAVAGNGFCPGDFIKHSEQIAGLLVEKEVGHYEFAHLSFQEYLAAVEVKETGQEEILLENINNSWWRETIHLYAAGNDTTSLVRAALNKPSVVSLTIALGCLKEGKSLNPEERQKLEKLLEDGLGSANSGLMKLAAEVRLANRLNRLLRIDDKHHIDQSYITCAEYQLFINEKYRVSQLFQPDHWTTNHFWTGMAKQPITGVRASDTQEFCEWLTQRDRPQEFRYRLPTLAEAEAHRVQEKLLGCWCQDEQGQVIAGIEPEQWQDWQEGLSREVTSNFAVTSNVAVTSNFKDIHTYTRTFARELARNLAPLPAQVGNLETALVHSRANNPERIRNLIVAYNNTLSRIRTCILELVGTGNLTRINNFDNELDHAIDSVKDRLFTNINAGFTKISVDQHTSRLTDDLIHAVHLADDLATAQEYIKNLGIHLKDIFNCVGEFSNHLTQACELAPRLAKNLPSERERQLENELDYVRTQAFQRAKQLSHDLAEALTYARNLDHILVKAGDICSDLSDAHQLVSNLTEVQQLVTGFSQRLTPDKKLVFNTYQTLLGDSEILAKKLENIRKLVRNSSRHWNGTPANELAHQGDLSCIRYYCLLISGFSTKLSNIYQEASGKPKLLKALNLSQQKCESSRSESISMSSKALDSYAFFMLLEARREGRIPPCEGIRIVREAVE